MPSHFQKKNCKKKSLLANILHLWYKAIHLGMFTFSVYINWLASCAPTFQILFKTDFIFIIYIVYSFFLWIISAQTRKNLKGKVHLSCSGTSWGPKPIIKDKLIENSTQQIIIFFKSQIVLFKILLCNKIHDFSLYYQILGRPCERVISDIPYGLFQVLRIILPNKHY